MTFDVRQKQMRADRLGAKWELDRTRCPCCGRTMWFTDFETIPEYKSRMVPEVLDRPVKKNVATLDHVVPLSKGGPHHHMNIVVMCLDCNERKGADDPEEWLEAAIKNYPEMPRRFISRTRRQIRTVRRKIRAIETKENDQ